MPQDKKLAELIREKLTAIKVKQISQPTAPTADPEKSLITQARDLIDADTQSLVEFGKKFQIPKVDNLDPHLAIAFNDFLVEPLLHEGSLLLDRCLQQRREYKELKTKWFEACVLVDEFLRLNDITEREEEENYEIPRDIAQFEQNVLNEEKNLIESTLLHIKLTSEGQGDIWFRDAEIARAQAQIANASGNPDMVRAFTLIESFRRMRERYNVEKNKGELFSQTKSIEDKLKAAEKNVILTRNLAKFQRLRNNVTRLVGLRRALQLIQPSGALNFLEQMQPIGTRLQNDLIAAYYRLSAASDGLSKLYQYPNSFPKLSENREVDFDDLVTWCQYTNTWLAAFLDKQQQVTRSFSLRNLLSEQNKNFDDGLNLVRWQFRLKEEHFYNSKFVRLRGFAIQIDSGHFSGNWNIAITPPSKALMRSEKPEVQKLDQKVGPLYLGRINETTFQVVPESAAPPKLYNASPIGQDNSEGEWKIEIIGRSTNDKPSSSINDIDIHLTVALV